MNLLDSTLNEPRLIGWALLLSAGSGAVAGAVLSSASSLTLLNGILAGVVAGLAMTLLFETPVRILIRGLREIEFGWFLVVPFIILRIVCSLPGVLLAKQIFGQKAAADSTNPSHNRE